MKYTITSVSGMTETVEADACRVVDGALVFEDEDGNTVRACAPGTWHSVEGNEE